MNRPPASRLTAADLPAGAAPPPVPSPHFPDRLHAFVWRNWTLIPLERLAAVVGAAPEQVREIGQAMGLPEPPPVPEGQERRTYITVIKRNWHLLPYEQLLQLLGWSADELAYVLQEDDFLFIKLGRLKPQCEPLQYTPPGPAARARAAEIAGIVRESFGERAGLSEDPLFSFVERLSTPPAARAAPPSGGSCFSPRFCYSYFALYGDPLLDPGANPFPDGYLARLAQAGVDGVWLQGVLYKLAPFPWDPSLSDRQEERLENLRALVERAGNQGVGIWLYLNEPRSMPLAFYDARPELKGVTEGEHAALCTSVPEVRAYLADAVEGICRAVPGLAGFFTITASENFTNCWSHHRGAECPRCGPRGAAEVIAEVNRSVWEGIRRSGTKARLLAWDWGWKDEDAPGIIAGLPQEAALQSVSEWSIPITRGGVQSVIGEYSISEVGPGPRATRHWGLARERGMKTVAKIQANNTWELSAVPYLPVLENVARHAANLRQAGVDGLMLGWTLGGYPSPNLEVVAEIGRDPTVTPVQAMERVARRLYGEESAPAIVEAWRAFSRAFSEFPYHIGTVYTAPLQAGPANPLWEAPTGYRATMVGLPYDDLDTWRSVFPAEVFEQQFSRLAQGFSAGKYSLMRALTRRDSLDRDPEAGLALAIEVHYHSVASQVRWVSTRRQLAEAQDAEEARRCCRRLEAVLLQELRDARIQYWLQVRDSRIGFEASNQYYYVPLDLVEKVLNCRDLLDRWLPAIREKWGLEGG